jgi:hypothetical protein
MSLTHEHIHGRERSRQRERHVPCRGAVSRGTRRCRYQRPAPEAKP